MHREGVERAGDAQSRSAIRRRRVKLPGEERHAERADSAVDIARKLQIKKREKRLREMERKIGR